MSETDDDPFVEFAKAMTSTDETVKKVKAEEPELPSAGSSIEEIIDSYGKFTEHMKMRAAAERAWVKSRKEYLESMLLAELDRRGFKASFASEEPSLIPFGKISGREFTATVDYGEKTVFDQEALRAIDLKTVASSAGAPPVGLSVKYTAAPDKAVEDDVKADLTDAITGYQYSRRVSFVRNEELS